MNGGDNLTWRLLQRLVEEVSAIREQLGRSESQSSVQLATSARGTDITVKAYPGSPVVQAGDAALEEYLRLRREVESRIMEGFAKEASKR